MGACVIGCVALKWFLPGPKCWKYCHYLLHLLPWRLSTQLLHNFNFIRAITWHMQYSINASFVWYAYRCDWIDAENVWFFPNMLSSGSTFLRIRRSRILSALLGICHQPSCSSIAIDSKRIWRRSVSTSPIVWKLFILRYVTDEEISALFKRNIDSLRRRRTIRWRPVCISAWCWQTSCTRWRSSFAAIPTLLPTS